MIRFLFMFMHMRLICALIKITYLLTYLLKKEQKTETDSQCCLDFSFRLDHVSCSYSGKQIQIFFTRCIKTLQQTATNSLLLILILYFMRCCSSWQILHRWTADVNHWPKQRKRSAGSAQICFWFGFDARPTTAVYSETASWNQRIWKRAVNAEVHRRRNSKTHRYGSHVSVNIYAACPLDNVIIKE